MHCVYCGVDYSLEDSCLCLPPARKQVIASPPRVEGPWGEAARNWSARPSGETGAGMVAKS